MASLKHQLNIPITLPSSPLCNHCEKKAIYPPLKSGVGTDKPELSEDLFSLNSTSALS